jgi:hypothetical protein
LSTKRVSMQLIALAVSAIGLLAGETYGQAAVQWRTEDGGNGHWYTVVVVPPGVSWTGARTTASSRGGYLASVRSTSEGDFINALAQSIPGAFIGEPGYQVGPWIGGFRVIGSNTWQWLGGESWNYADWCLGEPNGGSGEPYVHLSRVSGEFCWNDREDFAFGVGNPSFVLETHTRPDGPVGPIEWSTSAGGNGHWYELVVFTAATGWQAARSAAEERGGHLATFTSAAENAWVFSNVAQFANGWSCGQDCYGPWIGGFQDRSAPDFAEPAGGWRWVTGEPWSYSAWEPNLPNNAVPLQDFLHYYGPSSPTTFFTPASFWDDMNTEGPVLSMVVEYEADCDGDGKVDIGQILDGSRSDANGDGVPDCCESAAGCCPGDVTGGGEVNGVDLAAVLGAWGTDGQGKFDCDIDDDGIVTGADLAFVLGGWGPCSY